MVDKKISEELIKNAWLSYMTLGEMPEHMRPPWFERRVFRPLVKRMPKSPRCAICYVPFEGIGGSSQKHFGISRHRS